MATDDRLIGALGKDIAAARLAASTADASAAQAREELARHKREESARDRTVSERINDLERNLPNKVSEAVQAQLPGIVAKEFATLKRWGGRIAGVLALLNAIAQGAGWLKSDAAVEASRHQIVTAQETDEARQKRIMAEVYAEGRAAVAKELEAERIAAVARNVEAERRANMRDPDEAASNRRSSAAPLRAASAESDR